MSTMTPSQLPNTFFTFPEHQAITQQRLESEREKYGSFEFWNTKHTKKTSQGQGCGSTVEHLSSVHEALGPSTALGGTVREKQD